jgi:hypothetical protein
MGKVPNEIQLTLNLDSEFGKFLMDWTKKMAVLAERIEKIEWRINEIQKIKGVK